MSASGVRSNLARMSVTRANAAVVLAPGAATHRPDPDKTVDVIQQIIEESKDQLVLVEQQLKALRAAYPEVMASIRTRQVAQEMLLAKEAHIYELKSSGLPPVTFLVLLWSPVVTVL